MTVTYLVHNPRKRPPMTNRATKERVRTMRVFMGVSDLLRRAAIREVLRCWRDFDSSGARAFPTSGFESQGLCLIFRSSADGLGH